MTLDPKLLEILVCPRCRGALRYEENPPSLVCERDRLRYEVRNGIPVLLIDEARPL
ncbi:MAG: Trm112 family protein [Gemmatimonadota bacterium]|nr:Trm112 family protein [Gemmatimonadota bacterium]